MSFDAVITEQDRLLTINHFKDGEVLNALPGVHISPMYLDTVKGTWALYARFEPGTLLPKHYHSGTVHFYTTKGSWNYVEHPEDPQTAGSYLFEPAGSFHTFESKEGAEGFLIVEGANVNLNEDGSLMFIMDAGWIEQTIIAVARETGQELPPYIKPGDTGFAPVHQG
ncbi:MAG: 2,4'-dihydroxyacetophenone dioxygenase family protein [Rhodobacter sp.]|nr:2,4'-dihydroxyacetophenone dioxygenase family protein [Rhodobacter sp.]